MKDIANFILAIVILWVQSLLWGDYFRIDGLLTLLIAGVLLFVAEILVSVIMFFVMSSMLLSGRFVSFAICLISAMMLVEYFALSLLDMWLPGLAFVGFLPKIVTAFLLSLFRIPDINARY